VDRPPDPAPLTAAPRAADASDAPPRPGAGGGGRHALGSPGGALAACLLLVLTLFAFAGPVVRQVDPTAMDLGNSAAPSTAAHPLGTDESGRDVLARLMYGGRVTLLVAGAAVLVALVIGVVVGGLAGTGGRWADMFLMRLTDSVLAMPAIFLSLTILTFFGATTRNIVIVIGLTSWMGIARLVRAEVLAVREQLYVEAARALGAGGPAIFARHVLPQLVPTLSVAAAVGVASAILIESALSFLGLGVQPPAASWGNMLSGAQSYVYSAPRLALYPGLLIVLTAVAFSVIADRVREALDPHRRSR
jgi:peptide/nickel transport system permease protein